MKNSFLIRAFVCLFTVVALCSCKKDDDDATSAIIGNTITATVENGRSYNGEIDAVKLMIPDYKDKRVELASATYSDGGFTLELPETVSDTYLKPFAQWGFVDGIQVSSSTVKGWGAVIYAYNSTYEIGRFDYRTSVWMSRLVYVNGDVNITGSGADEDGNTVKYNAQLKTGWNMMYLRQIDKGNDTYEMESTTQTPSGLKWYYVEN